MIFTPILIIGKNQFKKVNTEAQQPIIFTKMLQKDKSNLNQSRYFVY